MSESVKPNRREFLTTMAGLGALVTLDPLRALGAVAGPTSVRTALSAGLAFERLGQEAMPTRPIPSTGEQIPVVGFGSTKSVLESPTNGTEPIANVIRRMLALGGRVVDTSPRSAAIDREFGRVLQAPDIRDHIFLATKVYTRGEEAGLAQMRQNRELLAGGRPLDLLQVESLRDLEVHWPNVRRWKDSGDARYIGVTVFTPNEHERLEAFMRREPMDFVHLNYSIMERQAEERLLPLAQDRGMAVIVNRPFMNGEYFGLVANRQLPDWAAEFDCTAWSQFSLKYILAHPAVTCVLTETTNPAHMDENARAAFGRLPDAAQRRRMIELVESF